MAEGTVTIKTSCSCGAILEASSDERFYAEFTINKMQREFYKTHEKCSKPAPKSKQRMERE